MPLSSDPTGTDDPVYRVAIDFKHEMLGHEWNPASHLPAWLWYHPSFTSPPWFFEDDGASRMEDKQLGLAAKNKFAEFLDGLRGPYYVTSGGHENQIVSVTILDPRDRDDFAEKYPTWERPRMDDYAGENARILFRLMLLGYRGETERMSAVLHAIEAAFFKIENKLELLRATNALDEDCKDLATANNHGRATLDFIRDVFVDYFPDRQPVRVNPPLEGRDFDATGLD